MSWVIVDIDGTLCDITHRLHFIQGKKDWEGFNSQIHLDAPKWPIINLVKILTEYHRIALVTGRQERYRKETLDWMDRHDVPYDMMVMRPTGNMDSDYIIKQEAYNHHFKGKEVFLVIDDRQAVVEMWRRNGLTCLQCQKGDY